jgi:hypothetical protein
MASFISTSVENLKLGDFLAKRALSAPLLVERWRHLYDIAVPLLIIPPLSAFPSRLQPWNQTLTQITAIATTLTEDIMYSFQLAATPSRAKP